MTELAAAVMMMLLVKVMKEHCVNSHHIFSSFCRGIRLLHQHLLTQSDVFRHDATGCIRPATTYDLVAVSQVLLALVCFNRRVVARALLRGKRLGEFNNYSMMRCRAHLRHSGAAAAL